MKIGILTHFHKSVNYGGVLQAYALCKYLNTQGYSAQQILYTACIKNLDSSAHASKNLFKSVSKRIKRKLNKEKNIKIKNRMENLFKDFREQVPHTASEYTKDTIANVNREFDAVLVGSDQVWNPAWFDSSYMLDFIDKSIPKISYSASMGVSSLTEEQKAIYKKYLVGFEKISVREQACADVLSDVLKKNIHVCVDPTLLLSVEQWDEIASERIIKEKYAFLYMLGDDIKVRKTAEKFAKEKGLQLILIPDLLGEYRAIDRKIKGVAIEDVTPCDFISLIKYADYIFTDSFHACVFSLLYEKDFFVFPRSGKIKMESRIRCLTELFECTERFCVDNDITFEELLSMDTIDYQREHKQFIVAKQESVDYLHELLKQ